ncbi:MAG: hypothetical protein R2824_18470 [Saprospiraceae bacterium]
MVIIIFAAVQSRLMYGMYAEHMEEEWSWTWIISNAVLTLYIWRWRWH